MQHCLKCGFELQQGMIYCPKCGNKCPVPTPRADTTEININTDFSKISSGVPEKARKKHHKLGLIICIALIITLLVLIATQTPLFSKSILNDPDTLSKLSTSVVMIECYDIHGTLYSTGSGFVAYQDDIIITNYHVIEQEAYQIYALTEDGQKIRVTQVLAYDAEKDIAILKLSSTNNLVPLPLGNSDNLLKGDTVVAIGSPLGLLNSISEGIVSGFVHDSLNTIQFTAAISHGSSGGPLFDDHGNVVGVTYASYEAGQSLNLAVPINTVNDLWEKAENIEPLSVEAFYNLFEHALSFEEVLNSKSELDGQEIVVEAIVSSVSFWSDDSGPVTCYYLVGSPEDVLGGIFDGTESVSNNGYFAAEVERNQAYQSIEITPFYENSATNELCLEPVAPGTIITVKGVLTYGNSVLNDGTELKFLSLKNAELVK